MPNRIDRILTSAELVEALGTRRTVRFKRKKHKFIVSYDEKAPRGREYAVLYKRLFGDVAVGHATYLVGFFSTRDEVTDYINLIEHGGL